ncbi:hypothetical protein PRO82_001083 [Candidatus Protochlamydia amoebophila]|nr:hypothetical protein [Candidatus Protochlamydia amoebophila]
MNAMQREQEGLPTFGAKLSGIYLGLNLCEIPFPNKVNIY